jgi:LasA protease
MPGKIGKIALLLGGLLLLAGCVQPAPQSTIWLPSGGTQTTAQSAQSNPQPNKISVQLPSTRVPGSPILTPTPDAPRPIPTLNTQQQEYVIQAGDTLGKVANAYNVSLQSLIEANDISDPNIVSIGQQIIIPVSTPQPQGTSFKIIPDSELVYNPTTILFDVFSFIKQQGGYLFGYREQLDDGSSYTGAEIILKVSREFSVNPRLLLAVLEYQSGWVTDPNPAGTTLDYPIGLHDTNYKGLYLQLSWAANNLNRGYYLWKVNGVTNWLLSDGGIVPPDSTINAGTAGVQALMGYLYTRTDWDKAVGPEGVFKTYSDLFGYPFDYAMEPELPPDLAQPVMDLPFASGETWSFTGGPHGGWGAGSAWAALDFAPPGDNGGCYVSDYFATAVADGLVVRSETGVVVLDLDQDGYEQTGWTVLYLHMADEGRVAVGTFVKAGDPIGHPSCQGGVSEGTHVHLARRYNGEWISADGSLPFVLSGWTSSGTGTVYDGTLTKNGITIEAWDSFVPENQISW